MSRLLLLSKRLAMLPKSSTTGSHPPNGIFAVTMRSFTSKTDEDAEAKTDEEAEDKADDEKNTMSRKQLAAVIAKQHEITRVKSEQIIKSIFETIVEKVSDKGQVKISDFGVFYVHHSEPRTYRHPSTGEALPKPAVDRPKFKPYDFFKKEVKSTEKVPE